jgi:hypothetical protein
MLRIAPLTYQSDLLNSQYTINMEILSYLCEKGVFIITAENCNCCALAPETTKYRNIQMHMSLHRNNK